MENWMIGARMVILLYCIIRYISSGMENIPFVILMMLAYISSAALSYIWKKAALKRGFRIISIAILILSSIFSDPLFILLIAIDILELLSDYVESWKVLLLAIAIPAYLFGAGLLAEYIVFSLLVLLIYLLAARHYETLSVLKKANEKLRSRNEELMGRLDAGSEYEAQLRYLSQIEERNSLAQKIHDKVGHTLAGSIIQLEAAGLIMGKDRDKAENMICNVTENLKEGMESIRSTLRTIKPAPEQLGFNRLKLMLEEYSRDNPIKTSLFFNGKLNIITHMQWKIIMDNIKEALTNALKYSAATRLDVKLDVMNKLIKAEVRDNGKGELSIKKGMGLSGMEERTENAGGKLILDGSNGFSVITLLPAENHQVESGNQKGSNDKVDVGSNRR